MRLAYVAVPSLAWNASAPAGLPLAALKVACTDPSATSSGRGEDESAGCTKAKKLLSRWLSELVQMASLEV